jgi:hypothetical protein
VAFFSLESEKKFTIDDINACFIVLRTVLIDLGTISYPDFTAVFDSLSRHPYTSRNADAKAGKSTRKRR